MGSLKRQLKLYRKQIGDAWLPIVGRRKLSPTEYKYTQELFDSSIEVDLVLRAIRRCVARARGTSYTIYSLGVIKRDLETIMRDKSKANVGGSSPDAWRAQWQRDLEDLIGMVDEPFRSAYQGLLGELNSLSREQAQSRWDAIQQMK